MEEPDDVENSAGMSEQDLEEPLECEAENNPGSEPDFGEPLFEARRFTTFWKWYFSIDSFLETLIFMPMYALFPLVVAPLFFDHRTLFALIFLLVYICLLPLFILRLSWLNGYWSYSIHHQGIKRVGRIPQEEISWFHEFWKHNSMLDIRGELIPYEDMDNISPVYDIENKSIMLGNLFEKDKINIVISRLRIRIKREKLADYFDPGDIDEDGLAELQELGHFVVDLRRPVDGSIMPVVKALRTAPGDGWNKLYNQNGDIQGLVQNIRRSVYVREYPDAFPEVLQEHFQEIAGKNPTVRGIRKYLSWRRIAERGLIVDLLRVMDHEKRTGERILPEELVIHPDFHDLLESGVVEFERI